MAAILLRALGVLILLSAVVFAISRAPDRPVESLVALWAPPPSDFIAVRGQVVHLRDEGPPDDPLPLVLLHGTSASLHTWEGWASVLRAQRRVISFDLPGFGLTGPFDADSSAYAADDYRGETYVQFVLDLLDTLNVPRVVLAGNSLGGEIAWRTALAAPERVSALVLVDAAGLSLGDGLGPQRIPLAWQVARVPIANRLLEWVLPRSFVAEGVASVYGDPSRVTPALVDRYFELTLREGNRRALVQRLQQMAPGEAADRLGAITQPTLILWGGQDRLIPPAAGAVFAERIPGARLVVFDGLGHVPQEEDPAATVAVLRDFLDTLANAPAAPGAPATPGSR
jgi:pimeloyl-ACP methyl ester carboxylesterase